MPKDKKKKKKNNPANVPLGAGLAHGAKKGLMSRPSRIEQAINQATGVTTTKHNMKNKKGKK